MMLATDAQAAKRSSDADPDSIRTNVEFLFGIPRVNGVFGLPPGSEPKTFEPSFVMNEKGGMQGGGLQEFIEHQILPAYPTTARDWDLTPEGKVLAGPTFMQLDAGPDRYTECSLGWRAAMWNMGLVLFPGLPNGTSANQLCDDLFGVYKSECNDRIDDILSERLMQNKHDPSIKVKLDFCDLGRVINGLHGDPISKRPFAKAFTAEKIVASAAKLGLNPINLGQALTHKRVRDDSSDGTRATEVTAVHESAARSLIEVASLGFNADAFFVEVEPPTTVATAASNIAGPSDFERAWQAVKAAGGCAGAHWAAVGAKAFNAPQVVGPALERVAERNAASQAVAAKKADTFADLRSLARELLVQMDDEGEDYGDLSAADVKALVSYVFRAQNKSGVGKVTTSKASGIEYLESLHDGFVLQLVDNPPASASTTAATGEPLLALLDAADVPVVTAVAVMSSAFDEILKLVPAGMSIATSPPDWLPTELVDVPTSEGGSQLQDKYILYKWPASAGGWLMGKVALNSNKKQKIGDTICNYKAFYEADKAWAYHSLTLANYAKSSGSKVDSWLLLE